MPVPSNLRRGRADDRDALAELKRATYRETFVEGFGIPYPPEDLAAYDAQAHGADAVGRELADPARATWVVERQGRLLGYASAGPCKLPHADAGETDGELYQLYIRREAQGLGIGRQLLDEALRHLDHHHPGPLWLGVWSGNLRAQAIYAARGFRKVGEYHFAVGSWLDDEFIFRRD